MPNKCQIKNEIKKIDIQNIESKMTKSAIKILTEQRPENCLFAGSPHRNVLPTFRRFWRESNIIGFWQTSKKCRRLKKRTVSVFVLDKYLRKFCRSTKDAVIKLLPSLGIQTIRIKKGTRASRGTYSYPSLEDCMTTVYWELIPKDLIRTKYVGMRKSH